MQNNTKKKIAPVVITILFLLYIGPIVAFLLMAATWIDGGFTPFILLYAAGGGAVIAGIITALSQRLKEIDGGEEEDAKKY